MSDDKKNDNSGDLLKEKIDEAKVVENVHKSPEEILKQQPTEEDADNLDADDSGA